MTRRADGDIERSIHAELRRSLSAGEAHIAVRVIGGAVTLTGWVNKYFHKYEAEDAVKRVEGVTAIANDVRLWHVTGSELSGPAIRRGEFSGPSDLRDSMRCGDYALLRSPKLP